MNSAALVSVVMPLFNDAATVETAIRSALRQTIDAVEVICVDDASSDDTVDVVERLQATDSRIRIVRHEDNRSAFQARRSGVLAATATHVLFLDGDDELTPDAAEKALAAATDSGAEIVGFGVTVVERDGRTGGAYEARLAPRPGPLHGSAVLRTLFPIGVPAQGQLWRYLFRTDLLRAAYAALPTSSILPRVNDLPLMFAAAALARSYAAIPDKLYRYHFGRGGSGHDIRSLSRAEFYISAIDSIDSIHPSIESLAATHAEPDLVTQTYGSVRESIIGYVCKQVVTLSTADVLPAALDLLFATASAQDVITAAAHHYPQALSTLKYSVPHLPPLGRPVRTVLLATASIRTGGVSMVIAAQAKHLAAEGYRVIVVAREGGIERGVLPPEAEFVQMTARTHSDRLDEWSRLCREYDADVVVDHQILYSDLWPEYALMARAEGAATIGWLHSFVLRPLLEGTGRLSYLERCAATLTSLIALSPLDVAYLKLRGIGHAAYLPNPPSQLLLEDSPPARPAPTGRLELIWWGRLEQRTKQVWTLIDISEQLTALGVDHRLTVVGPGWDDITVEKFNAVARRRGVARQVSAIGPRHGQELRRIIDRAHLFVSTSVIEGYQLTLAEAQSRALPVVMFDLPWLLLAEDNAGVLAVPQGDVGAFAAAVASLASDDERYERMSRASLSASLRARSHDFRALYRQLIEGALPSGYSPSPTAEDAAMLLGLTVHFAELGQQRKRPRASSTPGWGAQVWGRLAPAGRKVVSRFPGLRPLSHRLKGWLRAR